MPYFTYLFSTLVLYGSQIVLSLILDDIGVIFEFISAVAISSLAFTFPGVFYLMAERKYASTFHKESNRLVHYQAVAMTILGLFVFGFFMTANILEIVYAEEGSGGEEGEGGATRGDPNTITDTDR
jgi:amino acid permease